MASLIKKMPKGVTMITRFR